MEEGEGCEKSVSVVSLPSLSLFLPLFISSALPPTTQFVFKQKQE